jgi:predicted nucleic acid-binding protein
MPVVDASVCVALFKQQELGHRAAMDWFAAAALEEEPILAPVILLAEVAAALARANVDEPSPMAAIELLRGRRLLELFPIDERIASRAAVIAAALQINGADAIYVALADQLAIPLVTFDRQQLERGSRVVSAHAPGS